MVDERIAELATDKRVFPQYVSGLAVAERTKMQNTDYIYLLTLDVGPHYRLIGAFLDLTAAESAKHLMTLQGIDPHDIDIDQAPIGILDLRGIEKPYLPGPIH